MWTTSSTCLCAMSTDALTVAEIAAARAEAEGLSAAMRGLSREASQTAASPFEGLHSQRRSGVGETFWQFRPYQPGEPAQTIDWRQSARSTHHLVREHEWQAARTYWFWLDVSPSMRFSGSPKRPSKLTRGLVLLLAMATMAAEQGERVGLLGAQGRPGHGRKAVDRICLNLERLDEGVPDVGGLRLQPFSRVFLLSDFLMPLQEIEAPLAASMAAKLNLVGICVRDPVEASLPFQGRIRFEGLENEGLMLIDRAEASRASYQEVLTAHDAEIVGCLRRLDGDLVPHETGASSLTGLLTLLPFLQLATHAP